MIRAVGVGVTSSVQSSGSCGCDKTSHPMTDDQGPLQPTAVISSTLWQRPRASDVRSVMTWCKATFVLLVALAVGCAIAGDRSPIESLRARFPHGIPWRVEILGVDGKNMGALEMLITTDQATSCLGGMSDGVRVNFTRKEALSSTISVASYGVAKVTGDKIKIDLTGGICDAYLLMSGDVAADGSSTGDIYTFGMSGGHDVATYRATVK